ncbi:MAG: ABC transporter substrate-binding protein [Undibacterium sp.]
MIDCRKPSLRMAVIAAALASAFSASAQTDNDTLVVTTTDTLVTRHPYAESSAQMYSVWCQVYGCLGRYNYAARKFEGLLAERWEQLDDLTWRFHLRRDLVRHDGGPGPTTADVLHSYNQVMTDPQSQGRFYLSSVKEIRRVDDHTFDIITKEPTSSLLGQLFDKFTITSEEIFKNLEASISAASSSSISR